MQRDAWEKEYKKPTFITGADKPQAAVKRFLKWLKKEQSFVVEGKKILDLGSGTGRNSNYLASLGNDVVGLEISPTALATARNLGVGHPSKFIQASIGEAYPFENNTFDLILDITSSNSLTEPERDIYLKECTRVLKPSGFMFVRALAKEGDENAKFLLKNNPGPERDTYVMPETGIIERVFTKKDFSDLYQPYFKVLSLVKETHYSRMNNRVYKRNFWLAYLQK
jgi:SAM-dependent methyltransferase